MDTQTTELLGRHRLAGDLLRAGLEVALPSRDRGVDLIAYVDIDEGAQRFVARPIQMKVASRRSFGIWKKYLKIHELIFAFVWHLDGVGTPETYALTCAEAIEVGERMGWTTKASWTQHGGYGTTNPGQKLLDHLAPHLMTPDKWWTKVTERARG
jgi:hypothetical protein